MRSRTLALQRVEMHLANRVLNMMMSLVMPGATKWGEYLSGAGKLRSGSTGRTVERPPLVRVLCCRATPIRVSAGRGRLDATIA